jgi:hypothetical protein
MATLLEGSTGQNAGMGASLQAGVAQLSADQQFTFTLYSRTVLPADGFVFYVLASAANPPPVDPTPVELAAYSFTENGSLHVSQRVDQREADTTSLQDVVFTTKRKITEFSDMAPGSVFVMTLPNGSLIAFNAQRGRYDQAGIWHYSGRALYPYEATQIVNSPSDVGTEQIVSNSLPIWMAMGTMDLPVFPSFLVAQNYLPPYVVADIQGTSGIGQTPLEGPDSSQSQLAMETVRFTFYGLRNGAVLDFQREVLQNSLGGEYGIMNMPVPVDGKATQSEFGIIAQQKTMDVQVNYYQARAREIARKLILSAFITITAEG